MVTVKYRPNKRELSLKGHADYGEYGSDIVCASVSMVFYNLCAMLREYGTETWKKPLEMKDGNKESVKSVRASPTAPYETLIDHDFLYALKGFETLQGNFPECINLVVTQK